MSFRRRLAAVAFPLVALATTSGAQSAPVRRPPAATPATPAATPTARAVRDTVARTATPRRGRAWSIPR